jgi:hypothetical protein
MCAAAVLAEDEQPSGGAQRMHTEGIRELYEADKDISNVNSALWELGESKKRIRRHQHLGQRTPKESLGERCRQIAPAARLSCIN